MKNNKTLSVLLFVVLAVCIALGTVVSSAAKTDVKTAVQPQIQVDSRIENMLNSNRVYNDGFADETHLLEEAAIALSDRQVNGFVSNGIVEAYLTAMYSVTVNPESFNFPGAEKAEGYMPLPCRGYTDYTHKITKVVNGGDGTVTVYSDVTLDYHDGAPETKRCETLFCVNEDSPFGYNIVYSDIR